MKEKFTVEQMAPIRWFYNCIERNAKGERLVIEVSKIIANLNDKNGLMNLWKKNGFIENVLPTHWSIDTFVYDTEGNCFGMYNPTEKWSKEVKRNVINFDWLLEATEENLNLLLEEVYNRFMSTTDKTEAELKL